jgi:hypothetical protein
MSLSLERNAQLRRLVQEEAGLSYTARWGKKKKMLT